MRSARSRRTVPYLNSRHAQKASGYTLRPYRYRAFGLAVVVRREAGRLFVVKATAVRAACERQSVQWNLLAYINKPLFRVNVPALRVKRPPRFSTLDQPRGHRLPTGAYPFWHRHGGRRNKREIKQEAEDLRE